MKLWNHLSQFLCDFKKLLPHFRVNLDLLQSFFMGPFTYWSSNLTTAELIDLVCNELKSVLKENSYFYSSAISRVFSTFFLHNFLG